MPFRLTTVATFRTPIAAWVARNYLTALGIRSFVIDENISTAIWTWGNATGWTKLQVETEFEQAAYQALKRHGEARELLRSECQDAQSLVDVGSHRLPPCMDRKPITAAEGPQRKMNEREDLVRRAKLAAVFAFILFGNPLGLPGQWAQSSDGLFFLVGLLGLMGYSTWLLWSASASNETLRPVYQGDLFWGRCLNAILYSALAIVIIFVTAHP